MKIRSILVTGGTGFIGSSLARKLIRDRVETILFDNNLNLNRIRDIVDDVEIFEGDISSRRDLMKCFTEYEIDVIVHLASLLSIKAEEERELSFKVNIEGLFNLLEFSLKFNVKRIVFASSLSVFGPASKLPFNENTFRDPASFYGVTKAAGEILGRYYFYKHGIGFRVARLPSVIGPGRRGLGATVSVSKFIEDVVRNGRGVLRLPEYTMLPVIYIDDAVDALYKLIYSDGVDGRIFNFGGVILSVEDLINFVRDKFGSIEMDIELDERAEEIAMTWTILSKIVRDSGLDNVYHEYKDIGWRLKYDTPYKILDKFVSDVRGV